MSFARATFALHNPGMHVIRAARFASRLLPPIAVAAICTLFSGIASAEHFDTNALIEGADVPPDGVVEERRARIEVGLEELGEHPWAGWYFRNDSPDSGESLLLSPNDGAIASRGGMGRGWSSIADVSEEPDGTLVLAFPTPPESAGHPKPPVRLVPVRWGKRHYLAQVEELATFASEINFASAQRGSRYWSAFLRASDRNVSAEGLPALPEEFARLIRTESVELPVRSVTLARIERIDIFPESCRIHYRVELDTSGVDRLHSGQYLAFGPDTWKYLRLESVGPNTSVGTFVSYENDCDSPGTHPDAKWRVHTGAVGWVRERG